MSHSISKYIFALLTVILVAGCGSPVVKQVLATPTPVSAGVKVLGYNFKTKSVGSGWNEGTVQLAFENISDSPVGGVKVETKDIIVWSQENVTYPVMLNRLDPQIGDHVVSTIDLSAIPPVIPPHFRWTRVGSSGDMYGSYSLRFRYAAAAHPARIVFGDPPGWEIDLGAANQPAIAFPAERDVLASQPIKQLSDLRGRVLADRRNEIKVTLDGSGSQAGRGLELQYTVANRDPLNYHSTGITFTVAALFFGDGGISPKPTLSFSQGLGANPGQSVSGKMSLGSIFTDQKCDPKLYALVEDAQQPQDVPPDNADRWTRFLRFTGLARENQTPPQYTLYNLNVCR